MTPNQQVAVIGAGVIGLSVALQLARRGYSVTVIARELPGDWDIDYASCRAGAHFRPVPVNTAQDVFEHTLMRESYTELRRIADDPNEKEAGVAFIPAVEYFDTAPAAEELSAFATWPQYRQLTSQEISGAAGLSGGIKAGLTYSAWVIDTPAYLQWLRRQAESCGAVFLRARLCAPQEAAFVAQQHQPDLALPRVVINASGSGFNDPNCFPSRGQFMLISNSYHSTVSHHSADGHSTVVIPRPFGGTVIGGTKEPNNWSPNNSQAAIDEILRRVAAVCPDLPQPTAEDPSAAPSIQVKQAYIGRRPMRKGGLRLEKEDVAILKTSENGLHNESSVISVVHCYGAGPNGYKIGWAAASRVAALVDECFTTQGNMT